MNQKGFAHILLILIVLVGFAALVYFFKTSSKQNFPQSAESKLEVPNIQSLRSTISPIMKREIPATVKNQLPIESSDKKRIKQYYLSENTNYVVSSTFIENAGAGVRYDYWLFSLKNQSSQNLSSKIYNDSKFIELYKNDYNFEHKLLYITFSDRWVGENPVFEISNGWEILGDYWIYNIATNEFDMMKRE